MEHNDITSSSDASVRSPECLVDHTSVKPGREESRKAHDICSSNLRTLADLADWKLIQDAIQSRKIYCIRRHLEGLSSARKYVITTTQNEQYFAKLFPTTLDESETADMCREIEQTEWASQHGLGPALLATDTCKSLLVIQYLHNDLAGWHQGREEPRLSATLRTMRKLHRIPVDTEAVPFPMEKMLAFWEAEYIRTRLYYRRLPNARLVRGVILKSLNILANYTYCPAYHHGDLHQSNVIYSKGKAWLIDWGTRSLGDPMHEIAYYAYHVECPPSRLPILLKIYNANLPREDIARTQCHLALMDVRGFLEVLRHTSAATSTCKPSKMELIERFLLEDAELLSLKE